ncbi:hypothetical protein FKW77_003603 [Venturia effusa]|uniref:Amidohydrolase-related domain-containing protein n=1 Tax=Venturia effusa TaxID=50376 RepID=A0A517LIF9_9PEZI|nr:hypothetical protein FKW77_003603 [Venturia effusa]
MPSAIRRRTFSLTRTNTTKFTTCRAVKNDDLVYQDFRISPQTGRIFDGEQVSFKDKSAPDKVIDLAIFCINATKEHQIGNRLTLEGSAKVAGNSTTLIECANNFIEWSDTGIARALGAVLITPTKMSAVKDVKSSLKPGTDADFVILDNRISENGSPCQKVEPV